MTFLDQIASLPADRAGELLRSELGQIWGLSCTDLGPSGLVAAEFRGLTRIFCPSLLGVRGSEDSAWAARLEEAFRAESKKSEVACGRELIAIVCGDGSLGALARRSSGCEPWTDLTDAMPEGLRELLELLLSRMGEMPAATFALREAADGALACGRVLAGIPAGCLAALPEARARHFLRSLIYQSFPGLAFHRSQEPRADLVPGSGYPDVPALSRDRQSLQPPEWFYKPVMIDIELTHRCNLRCRECDILEDVKRGIWGLEKELAIDLLRQASQLGIYCYGLTGGEPFLRADDLCAVIEGAPEIDCHKIQTNGTLFNTPSRAERLMRQLAASGFGSRNRLMKAALRCSIGIQNYEGGAPIEPALLMGRLFYGIFDPAKASLGYTLTHHIAQDPLELKSEFVERFRRANNFYPHEDLYHVRTILLHWTDGAEPGQAEPREPLGSLLGEYSRNWKCVDSASSPSPWPRLLVRADGEAYSCSCFGHVFGLGNVRRHSIRELVERANRQELFGIIAREGLEGYLGYAERKSPGISQASIPSSTSVCQICKHLKAKVEGRSGLPIIQG